MNESVVAPLLHRTDPILEDLSAEQSEEEEEARRARPRKKKKVDEEFEIESEPSGSSEEDEEESGGYKEEDSDMEEEDGEEESDLDDFPRGRVRLHISFFRSFSVVILAERIRAVVHTLPDFLILIKRSRLFPRKQDEALLSQVFGSFPLAEGVAPSKSCSRTWRLPSTAPSTTRRTTRSPTSRAARPGRAPAEAPPRCMPMPPLLSRRCC